MSTDAAVSSVLAAQAAQTQQQLGVALARKALDAQQAQGDAAVALLDAAAMAGKAEGRGGLLDTLA